MSQGLWSHVATFINLVTFFFSFSAFSVGLYISDRVKWALGRGTLARVVDAFLVAAAGLTVRTGIEVFAHLRWVSPGVATAIGDLALLAMAGGLFGAYLAIERYFRKMEARAAREARHPREQRAARPADAYSDMPL
ncbi:MAG: hypothetical protein VKP62_12475 [Candidatus Sericytochromatia bacterium]|nr:hypothetical protein [Candidatus Sericytochromatia bacterium]